MSANNNSQREYGPPRPRKAMVLCFDGTGNKFQGNAGDSNIIKIYGLLDRHKHHVRSYYQPGIGTYIEDSALSKTSRLAKIRSAYVKMKDQAVGTSFDQHVMAGYDFLMKYYDVDDDLYFFGFSRGAYIARFLAQMLDSVGLLSHGNEEMMRFAWKAFANWQTRMSETEEQRQKKREMFHFLRGFRETFSRPVRRIRFLGLFDTVNSVPRFETAWMSRTKFPYTCKSSALIIRHAVSIDEARAKFRQNLISQKRPNKGNFFTASNAHGGPNAYELSNGAKTDGTDAKPKPLTHTDTHDDRYKPLKKAKAMDTLSPNTAAGGTGAGADDKQPSRKPSMSSVNSQTLALDRDNSADDEAEDELAEQDIKEIWFPGDHGDIGGGWPVQEGLEATLSHAPLLWMIREARKAGVPFNQEALDHAGFLIEEDMPEHEVEDLTRPGGPPEIRVDDEAVPAEAAADKKLEEERSKALQVLYAASTRSMVHNALKFGYGTPHGGVLAWSMMEYMPFRRMDLRPDGTWAPIRWPLPCGEPRDIPDDALIHHTALKRMAANETYRPGNLIIGGGGRGLKIAPKDAGTGKWRIHSDKGSAVGECYTRAVKGGTWLVEQEEAKKAKKNGDKNSEPKV